jgi:hypothetical protein
MDRMNQHGHEPRLLDDDELLALAEEVAFEDTGDLYPAGDVSDDGRFNSGVMRALPVGMASHSRSPRI